MEGALTIRDIGAQNPYSMKNGVMFHQKPHLYFFLGVQHLVNYDAVFRTSPRRFKIHRSFHQYAFLGLSLYAPYRFDAQLNTVLFQLSKSSNPIVNFLLRVPSKVLIYATSVFVGQLCARLYWVYKRSYNAAKISALNTYLSYHIYAEEDYPYIQAFQEVRPNLVT